MSNSDLSKVKTAPLNAKANLRLTMRDIDSYKTGMQKVRLIWLIENCFLLSKINVAGSLL
jgi:hypothetical protein